MSKLTPFKRAEYWPAAPQSWYRVSVQSEHSEAPMFTGQIAAVCPDCQVPIMLDHEIDAAGAVHPSVSCSSQECEYQGFISLKGWVPPFTLDELRAAPRIKIDVDPKTGNASEKCVECKEVRNHTREAIKEALFDPMPCFHRCPEPAETEE